MAVLSALLLVLGLRAEAMDRWAALSQLESGDDDHAVGAAGEVSRYQLRPELWRRFASPGARSENADEALAVAMKVMAVRSAAFERDLHRAPTDFEFYILWNAPGQIQRPGKAVSLRARRFCNLVERH